MFLYNTEYSYAQLYVHDNKRNKNDYRLIQIVILHLRAMQFMVNKAIGFLMFIACAI